MGCLGVRPWKMGRFQEVVGGEEVLLNRRDGVTKAKNRAKLQAQVTCRRMLKYKFEKTVWAYIMGF